MKTLLTLVGYAVGLVASLYVYAAGAGAVGHVLGWAGVPHPLTFPAGMLLFGLAMLAGSLAVVQAVVHVADRRELRHQRDAPTAPTDRKSVV